MPIAASGQVSSGLARTKCETFRGGGTRSPCTVLVGIPHGEMGQV